MTNPIIRKLAAAALGGASLGALTLALAVPTAAAQAQEPTAAATATFDIPAQDAAGALEAFGRQSGKAIMYDRDRLGARRLGGVQGSYTPDEALRRLLAGSGLEMRMANANTFVVEAPGEPYAGGEGGSGEALAQGQRGIAEILVIGSKSQNVDIRRTEDDPQPYVVFDAKEIEQSGASSLEDFFRKRLPMNTQSLSNNQRRSDNFFTSNVSSINLRGLGVDETLILVDGRRAPRVRPVTGNSEFTQADINGIPLAAIERIEILPSTAGGIYGGGATGGVINIIRKRNYNGLDAQVGFEGAFRGGAEAFRAEINGGFSPDGGQTQISFSLSHQDRKSLWIGDNDLWRRSMERWQRFGGPFADIITFFSRPGFTTNALSADFFTPLTLDGGAPLNAIQAFVPVGYAGVASDGGAGLLAGAGRFNLDLSDDSFGRRAEMLGGSRVRSGNLNLRRSFGSRLELFGDLTLSENLGRSHYQEDPGPMFLLADDANNPFEQDIFVTMPRVGLDRPVTGKTTLFSLTTGAILKIGDNWSLAPEYGWSHSRSRNSLTANPLNSAAFDAIANGSLDPFRDLNAFPHDYSPYLITGPDTISGPVVTRQTLASIRASGSLYELPGGPISLTTLIEKRKEVASKARFIGPFFDRTVPRRSQAVESAYGEIRVPLVSERNARPLLQALELQASVRHDRYATRVASPTFFPTASPPTIAYDTTHLRSTNFTVAGRWAPTQLASLRASYSTGFLPPNISQLVANEIVTSVTGIADPRRGNLPIGSEGAITMVNGGNPDLGPEKSRSLSMGLVLNPLRGVRFSVDYSRIKKQGEIGSLGSDIAFLEEFFPDRIIRNTDPSTFGPFSVGPVTRLDLTTANVAFSRTQAWDFQLDYDLETETAGSFRLYAVATHHQETLKQILPTSTPFNSAGYENGPIKWRGNAGIDWSLNNWDLGWNAQYYHSYSVRTAGIPASSSDENVAQQGAERIPSRLYHDISLRYRFGSDTGTLLRGIEIVAGIQNLFDTKPPVLSSPFILSSYSFHGDPRLRRYTVTLRRHFGN